MNYLLCILLLIGCGDTTTVPPQEELPRLSISNVTLFEGNDETVFNFLVSTSKAWDDEISFDFATKEGTAGEATDYVENSGTLRIKPGDRSIKIPVEIVVDEWKETDEEFTIVLSNAMNATITQGVGIGTIRNDDTFVDIPDGGYITPEDYPGYNKVWSDEFDGDALNLNDWTHELGNSGWGNNEWQYYTDRTENAYLSDGVLTIEAKKENYEGASYTSARLITKDKKTFFHGRVDVRAILPEGQGIWPAIWMLGNDISTVGWPACGEIDIMELVGHEPSTVHGTAHWGPQGQTFSHYKGEGYPLQDGTKFSENYHVFSIIWESGKIEWYVDDNKFFTLTTTDVNGVYPFDDEFFFIMNIAVGGNWPGYPDETTVFPQKMIVDYIRVFERE